MQNIDSNDIADAIHHARAHVHTASGCHDDEHEGGGEIVS
jgi:hypothetical protein